MATPRSSTISPTIWAPNSELLSDSGIRDESATGSALAGVATAVPGAGDGEAEGLICGNRVEALPAGIVVDTPATAGSVVDTPATAGSAPSGMAAPTLSVMPDRPGISTVDPPGVVAEGDPAAAGFVVLELGVADGLAAALATVIVGVFAVAVKVALPSVTVTVALYLTVSPAVAVLGTVTCVSTWGADGLAAGTLRLQVVPTALVQPTVYAGAENAGVFALGVSVDVILPVASALRFV
jgi:hypothetical protein